jgi:hypothetical protein
MFQKTKNSFPAGVEMEGLTIWDVDPLGPPNIGGQIHIVWQDQEPIVDDDVFFSHLRVSAPMRDAL